jgi:hypothetical protein
MKTKPATPARASARARRAMIWTKARVERLKRLRRQGRTFREIALALRISRNQAIAKIRRLTDLGEFRLSAVARAELAKVKSRRLSAAAQRRHAKRRARRKSARHSAVWPYARRAKTAVELRVLDGEPEPKGGDEGCRWLRGPVAERNFCGHETEGGPWCAHHFKRVYLPPLPTAVRERKREGVRR